MFTKGLNHATNWMNMHKSMEFLKYDKVITIFVMINHGNITVTINVLVAMDIFYNLETN